MGQLAIGWQLKEGSGRMGKRRKETNVYAPKASVAFLNSARRA
jgi:hypothetical protein